MPGRVLDSKEVNMAKRKPISKALRFEVFKRDRFTCQYCGRKAPEVVLEVDHLIPVAEGGENELLNLVTSCFDCNRGKGKKKLNDTTAVTKQRAELERIAERQEQAKMMVQWKKEMKELDDMLVDDLCDTWQSLTGMDLTDVGHKHMKSYYNRFGYAEVMDAIGIAVDYYPTDDEDSADRAFNKIGGICYNRQKQRQEKCQTD